MTLYKSTERQRLLLTESKIPRSVSVRPENTKLASLDEEAGKFSLLVRRSARGNAYFIKRKRRHDDELPRVKRSMIDSIQTFGTPQVFEYLC